MRNDVLKSRVKEQRWKHFKQHDRTKLPTNFVSQASSVEAAGQQMIHPVLFLSHQLRNSILSIVETLLVLFLPQQQYERAFFSIFTIVEARTTFSINIAARRWFESLFDDHNLSKANCFCSSRFLSSFVPFFQHKW